MEEWSYTSTYPLEHNQACNGNTLIVEEAKESLGEKKGKRNEERFDDECRTAI